MHIAISLIEDGNKRYVWFGFETVMKTDSVSD